MAELGRNNGRRDSGSLAWPAGAPDADTSARTLNYMRDASEVTFDVDKFVAALRRETDAGALPDHDATMWLDLLRGIPKVN